MENTEQFLFDEQPKKRRRAKRDWTHKEAEIVREMLAKGYPLTQMARKLDRGPGVLHTYINRGGHLAPPGSKPTNQQIKSQLIEDLKKLVNRQRPTGRSIKQYIRTSPGRAWQVLVQLFKEKQLLFADEMPTDNQIEAAKPNQKETEAGDGGGTTSVGDLEERIESLEMQIKILTNLVRGNHGRNQ